MYVKVTFDNLDEKILKNTVLHLHWNGLFTVASKDKSLNEVYLIVHYKHDMDSVKTEEYARTFLERYISLDKVRLETVRGNRPVHLYTFSLRAGLPRHELFEHQIEAPIRWYEV